MNKNYETEARECWGATDAYREHEQKTKNYKNKKALTTSGLFCFGLQPPNLSKRQIF